MKHLVVAMRRKHVGVSELLRSGSGRVSAVMCVNCYKLRNTANESVLCFYFNFLN